MAEDSPDYEKLLAHWQNLERNALEPDEVFDTTARIRIGFSIAREAASAPGKVQCLKLARRTEAYYLLQAADAQDHAQRARSLTDREAWLRLAHSWLRLLGQKRAARGQSFEDAVDERSTGQNVTKTSQ